jgi:frataxin-like iron-binding protein CyaY
MTMRQFLILSSLWISSMLSAQKFEYTDYKWADTIAKFELTESELKKTSSLFNG